MSAFPPKAEAIPEIAPTASNTAAPGPAQPTFQNVPAKPALSLHWTRMWTTDSLDHSGDEVRACLHLASMPDLVDENGGAGGLEAV